MVGWIFAGLFASLLPIWRQGPYNRAAGGLDLFGYLSYANQKGYEPFGHPHIPYDQAAEEARAAYCECHSITRRVDA